MVELSRIEILARFEGACLEVALQPVCIFRREAGSVRVSRFRFEMVLHSFKIDINDQTHYGLGIDSFEFATSPAH